MLLSGMFKFMSLMYGYYFDPLSKDLTPTLKLKHHWAYDGEDGPANWHRYYEHCGGTRQSPVNLRDSVVEYDYRLPKVELYNFDVYSQLTGKTILNITNNGHSASCAIKGDYYVDGGGLGGHYRTAEFHFHWGANDRRGSEHAVGGRKYPLEMHIVNYAEKYGNLSSAMKHPDGLTVLGVLFEVSRQDNPALQPIMSALDNIINYADYHVINNCSVRALLPNDLWSYYRYEGSLTTPPCYESVIWTVFAETMPISRRQLRALRRLHQHQHDTQDANGRVKKGRKKMVDNFRPLQRRNNRQIHKSFLGNFVRGSPIHLSGPNSGTKFIYPTSAGPSLGTHIGFLGQQPTGGKARTSSKDASRILSAVQDAQKNSPLVSEANPRFGNSRIQSSNFKEASHHSQPSIWEGSANVRQHHSQPSIWEGSANVRQHHSQPSIWEGSANVRQHHSQPSIWEGSANVRQVSGQGPVRLTRGQFLPPVQTSSSATSFSSMSEGPANPYAVTRPKTINDFQDYNFGALGDLKKTKRRTSRWYDKYDKYGKYHVHDENCNHWW